MKLIPLYGKYGEGKFAMIDDEDYELVSQYRWRGSEPNSKGSIYAKTNLYIGNYTQKLFSMHKLVMDLVGRKDIILDHINNNTLDNQKSNLRIATPRQNTQNMRIKTNKLRSQYKGVCWQKSQCIARIQVDGESIYLGSFYNEEDAAKAYDYAAIQYFKEFANINFPQFDYSHYTPLPNQLDKSSKYKYIHWDSSKSKWTVQFWIHNKNKFVGRFKEELEAAKAADQYIKDNNLNKPLNFPDE